MDESVETVISHVPRPLFKAAMPASGKRIGGTVNWRREWSPWTKEFGEKENDRDQTGETRHSR
jgi:hypothetical protein